MFVRELELFNFDRLSDRSDLKNYGIWARIKFRNFPKFLKNKLEKFKLINFVPAIAVKRRVFYH